jgi:atypical dual specificity phosphatase
MPQASQILPCLYISDLWTATHITTIISLGITHRLSIQLAPLEPPPKNVTLKTKCIPLQDRCEARLWMYMDAVIDWISTALTEGGTVLVHCTWGKSRSVAFVVAFLMRTHRVTLDQALAYVQMKRPIAKPNEGFMQHLRLYEKGMKRVGKA